MNKFSRNRPIIIHVPSITLIGCHDIVALHAQVQAGTGTTRGTVTTSTSGCYFKSNWQGTISVEHARASGLLTMSTSSDEGWQELQALSRRQCPKLFYQYSAKDQSFTLLLTDLISIWETSPDKYDILAAAARQHTSIDPSISSTQFDLLLSKIRKSLSGGRNSIARGNVKSTQSLSLRTTFDLPGGLRPLEWTFNLEPQATAELAERILRPSLHEVSVSENKITSLLKVIREKDHVITRLSDRLASSDTDLSLVFPGIAGFASRRGTRHVSVADAKKHVPGMTVFDEKTWTTQFANDDGYEGADTAGLSNLVRGCEKCFVHSKTEHEDWIKDLPLTLDGGHKLSHAAQRKSPPIRSAKRSSANKDDSTDDEFEASFASQHISLLLLNATCSVSRHHHI